MTTNALTLHPQAPPDAQAELDELYGRFMAAMNQDDEAGAMAWEVYQAAIIYHTYERVVKDGAK